MYFIYRIYMYVESATINVLYGLHGQTLDPAIQKKCLDKECMLMRLLVYTLVSFTEAPP